MIDSLVGVVVGSLITGFLTYGFQKELLKQQLAAQERSHNEMVLKLKDIVMSIDVGFQNLRIS